MFIARINMWLSGWNALSAVHFAADGKVWWALGLGLLSAAMLATSILNERCQ